MTEEKDMIKYCVDNPDKTADEVVHKFEIPWYMANRYIKEAIKLKKKTKI